MQLPQGVAFSPDTNSLHHASVLKLQQYLKGIEHVGLLVDIRLDAPYIVRLCRIKCFIQLAQGGRELLRYRILLEFVDKTGTRLQRLRARALSLRRADSSGLGSRDGYIGQQRIFRNLLQQGHVGISQHVLHVLCHGVAVFFVEAIDLIVDVSSIMTNAESFVQIEAW